MTERFRTTRIAAVLLVLGLAGYLIICFALSGGSRPGRIRFVCVATGAFFDLNAEEAVMIPAKNHKTGQRTLLPCDHGEGGRYQVADTDRWLLEGELRDRNRYVDPVTLIVRSDP